MIRIALKTVLLSILFLLFYSSLLNGQVVSKIFSADKICQADQQFSLLSLKESLNKEIFSAKREPHLLAWQNLGEKFSMDSVILNMYNADLEEWDFVVKLNYIYDDHGRVMENYSYGWDNELLEWEDDEVELYTYDPKGNLISEESYKWDKNGEMLLGFRKTTFAFNEDGDKFEEIKYLGSYFIGGDSWGISEKTEWDYDLDRRLIEKREYLTEQRDMPIRLIKRHKYSYNDNGNQIFMIKEFYNSTLQDFVSDEKQESQYDSNDQMILDQYYKMEEENNQWTEYKRFSYDYYPDLYRIVETRYDRRNGDFGPVREFIFQYDPTGLLIEEIFSYWHTDSMSWIYDNKEEFFYDENNHLNQYFNYSWDPEDQLWIPEMREDIGYSASGLLLTGSYSLWDPVGEIWIMKGILEMEYDEKENRTKYERYLLNDLGEKSGLEMEIYEYNNRYGYEDLILPFEIWDEYQVNFKSMLMAKTTFEWQYDEQEWIGYDRVELFYSEVDVATEVSDMQKITFVYPNPSDTYINLTTDFTLGPVNLEIFDIQGRKVMEVVLIGSKKIPVSSLKNGLYVYKMYQMGRVSLGKFIVGKQ